MASGMTKLSNLVNPEVMADMVNATLPKKIKFAPFAKVDTTLTGRPGDTITVPKYQYIGDAEDVAEGVAMGTTVLTASTTTASVKKAGKAVELTDESILSGYGDPLGEAANQLAMSIGAKVDNDCYAALQKATLVYDGSAGIIGYEGVVNAVDTFEDETEAGVNKILFVHPNQVTQLRKDPNFLDINKYPITEDTTHKCYLNPIMIVDVEDTNQDPEADDTAPTAPALTIYMKRAVELEKDRDILKKTTVISADEHYTAVLSNESKVVLAKFAKTAAG